MNACLHCAGMFNTHKSLLRHIRNPPALCAIIRRSQTCPTCGTVCASVHELVDHVVQMCNARADTLQIELTNAHEQFQYELSNAHQRVAQFAESITRDRDAHKLAVDKMQSAMDTQQWKFDLERAGLERQITKLEYTVAEFHKTPRTQVIHTHNTHNTNHTQTNNVQVNFNGVLNLDPDHIGRVIDSTFNRDSLVGGIDSLVKYLLDNLLTGDNDELLYRLTDVSRYIFKFKDPATGRTIRDPKASSLLRAVMPSVYRHARELCPLGDIAWYDAERFRDDMGLRVLEASYDQVMSVSSSNPNAFLRSMVRAMGSRRLLPEREQDNADEDVETTP